MTPTETRDALIQYLKAKTEEGDWHGVSDAANDLRVLEARYPPIVRRPNCGATRFTTDDAPCLLPADHKGPHQYT